MLFVSGSPSPPFHIPKSCYRSGWSHWMLGNHVLNPDNTKVIQSPEGLRAVTWLAQWEGWPGVLSLSCQSEGHKPIPDVCYFINYNYKIINKYILLIIITFEMPVYKHLRGKRGGGVVSEMSLISFSVTTKDLNFAPLTLFKMLNQ